MKIIHLSVLVLILVWGFSGSIGCGDDDDDDEEEEGVGECTSRREFDDLVGSEYEVWGLDECAAVGIDIEIIDLSFNKGRTNFAGKGSYLSSGGPHFLLTGDAEGDPCYVELAGGEFSFSLGYYDCPGRASLWIYTVPDGSLGENMACIISFTPLPFPSDDCVEIND